MSADQLGALQPIVRRHDHRETRKQLPLSDAVFILAHRQVPHQTWAALRLVAEVGGFLGVADRGPNRGRRLVPVDDKYRSAACF